MTTEATPPPSAEFVEALAADLCDRAARPARSRYEPMAWEYAGRQNGGPPETSKRDWWRRHAREVIAFVVNGLAIEPTDVVRTVDELNALPVGTVIAADGTAYVHDWEMPGWWLRAGRGGRTHGAGIGLPVRVLELGRPANGAAR